MTTIHLNEEQAQSLISLIEHRLHDMDAACDNLERQQARLIMGWQSTSAVKFIADYRRIIHSLRNEIEELNRLQFTLQNEVRQWMDADKTINSSRQQWGQVLGAIAPQLISEFQRNIWQYLFGRNYMALKIALRENPIAPLLIFGTFPYFILPYWLFPNFLKPPLFPGKFPDLLPYLPNPPAKPAPEKKPNPQPKPTPKPAPVKPQPAPAPEQKTSGPIKIAEKVPATGGRNPYPRQGFSSAGNPNSNCTWYAAESVKTHSNGQITLPNWGNATDWVNNANNDSSGIVSGVDNTPKPGSIMWMDVGHVGFVESVEYRDGKAFITWTEEQATGQSAGWRDSSQISVDGKPILRWRITREFTVDPANPTAILDPKYNSTFIHLNYP